MFYRYELLNKVNLKHIQDFYNFSDFDDGARTGSKNKDLKNNVEMQLEHSNAAWRIIWDVWQVHTVPKERLFASRLWREHETPWMHRCGYPRAQ